MQRDALQGALLDFAEKEAAVQAFGEEAAEDFAAHAVLDVELGCGFAADDAAGEAADFARGDGVDEAEERVADVVFAQGLREGFEAVLVLHQRFGFGQQHFAGAGEAHAAVGAGEQRGADAGFEGFDMCGHGGLGEKQFLGGAGEVLGVGDGDEGAQLVDVHGGFLCSLVCCCHGLSERLSDGLYAVLLFVF